MWWLIADQNNRIVAGKINFGASYMDRAATQQPLASKKLFNCHLDKSTHVNFP